MKTPKWPLFLALLTATGFIVACGDSPSDQLTNQDVMCIKMMKYGGSCASAGATATATTTTATTTVTVPSSTTQ